MINKIYKLINNNFSRLFKFIFFIRYLFVIFFVATALYLFIPSFFDYKKKEENIKNYLFQNYGFKVDKMENLRYRAFPTPHLKAENLLINIYPNNLKVKTSELIIHPKLLNIYDYKNFKTKKIKLENNELNIDLNNINLLTKNILNIKKKIFIKNLHLKIYNKGNSLLNLRKINFSNYGYKKNLIDGEVFGKNFKINLKDNFSNIYFKILKTGVSFNLNILEGNLPKLVKGTFKGQVLKSKFKINFSYDTKNIKIEDLFFRDESLSFNSKGNIFLKPFFKINLTSEIQHIENKLIKNLNLNRILKQRELIRRINSKNNFTFKSKKFSRNTIDSLVLNTNLAFGRLNFEKNLKISKSNIICSNIVNLLEEFPILYFECSINSPDKKDLLKKFDIKYKNKKESFNLYAKGNLNIHNNKINFNFIKINNNEIIKQDLKNYKNIFEKILFNEDFVKIFNLSKIKNFIIEVS